MSNERDAENKPIPLLTTLDGKATTTDDAGKRTETVFHPAKINPVPTPGFDWMTALLLLAGFVPGMALVLPKLLAARAAVKEVVDGVQDWKSDMAPEEKAEFNATLAAKQSKKTKDIIAKHKGKT